MKSSWLSVSCTVGVFALSIVGCAEPPGFDEEVTLRSHVSPGQARFETAFSHTNGRSCADCHVADDAFALTPEHVQELLEEDPDNALFVDFDADVRGTENPTFNNLSHGLARVLIPLPDNMDVIDFAGNVVTPPDRLIELWRAVPGIENTATSGPFLYDGRAETLEEQALGAIEVHSQRTRNTRNRALRRIARFERRQFSSSRARFVAQQMKDGVPIENIPNPEDDPQFLASLTPEELHGKEVFDFACSNCHGGATGTQIVDRQVHDALCFDPLPDGNLARTFTDINENGVLDPFEGGTLVFPAPEEGCGEFVFIGITAATVLGKIGLAFDPQPANVDVDFPTYRFRFYRDDARTEHWTDLPPLPLFDEQGAPLTDEAGVPIAGPAGGPIPFTTDPGRALITGNPSDWEGFDSPQLRGIADTAPYFHDNNVNTLEEVVDLYSRAILPAIPGGFFPPIIPTPQPSFFPGEALTAQEKADLVAYMEIY